MKNVIARFCMAVALLCSVPLATACSTLSAGNSAVISATGLSPAQNLYRAHGLYNIALQGAVTYSESTYATPSVVASMTSINRQAKPAFEYAEAVIACAGPGNSGSPVIIVANARCSVLDLSPQALAKNASVLDWARRALTNLLGSK